MLAIVLLCLSRVPAYAQIAFATMQGARCLMCSLPHTTKNRPFTLLGDELEMRRSMRFFQSIRLGISMRERFKGAGEGHLLDALRRQELAEISISLWLSKNAESLWSLPRVTSSSSNTARTMTCSC